MKFLIVAATSLQLLSFSSSSSFASSSNNIIANNGDSSCRDDETFRYRQKQNAMNGGEESTGLLRNTKVLKDCEWIHHHHHQSSTAEEQSSPCNWHVDFDLVSDYCPVTCNTCQRKSNNDVIEENTIFTDSLCYEAGQTRQVTQIIINYENQHPQLEDWIGIYYSDANSQHLPKEPIGGWTYLTGNQQDMTKASYGQVIIETYLRPEHSYKAVLSRKGDQDGPYKSFAESQIFEFTSHQQCEARRRTLQQQRNNNEDDYTLSEDTIEAKQSHSTTSSCSPELSLNKLTYVVGDDIVVDLTLQTNGRNLCFIQISNPDAYVAIYDARVDPDEIWGDNNYDSFVWTCGNQSCHNHDVLDKVKFTKSTTTEQWPLPAGEYKAHLIVPISKKRSTVATTTNSNNGGGGTPTQHDRRRYYSIAQSPTFNVLQNKGKLENVGS